MIKVFATALLAGAAGLAACGSPAQQPAPPTAAAPATPPATTAPSVATATAEGPAEAEAFLRTVALADYATPATSAAHGRAMLNQTSAQMAARAPALFTPAVAAVLARYYSPANPDGIDFMPLCLCQDDAGMVVRSMTTATGEAGRVEATTAFANSPGAFRYTLERTPAGWRIADIHRSGVPGDADMSLVATLGAGPRAAS